MDGFFRSSMICRMIFAEYPVRTTIGMMGMMNPANATRQAKRNCLRASAS
jgi:hypothetical protein